VSHILLGFRAGCSSCGFLLYFGILLFDRNAILFVQPLAEIDHLAARTAEWKIRVGGARLDRSVADWTLRHGGKFCVARRAMVYRSGSAPDSDGLDPELRPFLGLWIDTQGRALFVKRVGDGVRVSVAPGITAAPYKQSGLVFDFPTNDLEARLSKQQSQTLEVEAGSPGLGPTYRLERTSSGNRDGNPRRFPETSGDRLLPSVHMGLYDDYDDDFGVPWAFPLEPYRRATPDERMAWGARAENENKSCT
jgi:hypothetical protein